MVLKSISTFSRIDRFHDASSQSEERRFVSAENNDSKTRWRAFDTIECRAFGAKCLVFAMFHTVFSPVGVFSNRQLLDS